MTEYTQELHDRLRELDQKASPAPWSYNPWSADSSGEATQNITCGWGEDEEILIGEASFLLNEPDSEMIAESRNAIPALLAEIERLQAEVKKSELAYGRGMSDAMVQFYGEELPKAKRLAWDECATKAHEFRVRTETADKLMQANPYRKEES